MLGGRLNTSESDNLSTTNTTRTQISEYLRGTYKPTYYSTARVKRTNNNTIESKISTRVNCTSTGDNTKARTNK